MHLLCTAVAASSAALMLGAIGACLASALAYTTLSATDAHARLQQGWFGALVDTRDAGEWAAGHIPNATFVDSLQSTGDTSLLAGCQTCRIAVYCHSGVPRRVAVRVAIPLAAGPAREATTAA